MTYGRGVPAVCISSHLSISVKLGHVLLALSSGFTETRILTFDHG